MWTDPRLENQLCHLFQPGKVTLQTLYDLVETVAKYAAKNKYLRKFLTEVQGSDIEELLEKLRFVEQKDLS